MLTLLPWALTWSRLSQPGDECAYVHKGEG